MSSDVYNLWAVWADRPETTAACAAHLARMLEDLAAAHPAFARWNEQADTEEEAYAPFCSIPPRIEELTEIFEQGKQYTDHPRLPMPDLGYWVSAWNGIEGPCGVMLILNAGSYKGLPAGSNHVEISFRHREPGNEDFLNATVMRQVLLAVAGAWEPDWAVIESKSYHGKLKNPAGNFLRPWGGWITYLSPFHAQRFTPPPAVLVEPASSGGLLIVATEEPFTVDNPEHVAAADAVQLALKAMRPVSEAPSSK